MSKEVKIRLNSHNNKAIKSVGELRWRKNNLGM